MKRTTAFLCYAYGETDMPCVRLANSGEDVAQFIVDEWLDGNSDNPELQPIMAEFVDHDWDEGPMKLEFETGGVTIERVFASLPDSVEVAAWRSRLMSPSGLALGRSTCHGAWYYHDEYPGGLNTGIIEIQALEVLSEVGN